MCVCPFMCTRVCVGALLCLCEHACMHACVHMYISVMADVSVAQHAVRKKVKENLRCCLLPCWRYSLLFSATHTPG